ncbi:MAG: BMP family ABC transporter substrate-binding protein [Lachnospiraceae bacterium]|nr:BMP family ABC transporter substrate-binding protein [Lachnospiraceae bacterium]
MRSGHKRNKGFKLFSLLIILSVMLSACASGEKAEVIMVTDLGTIYDGSFNQGTYEGIKKYAEEAGISYNFYQPEESNEESYLKTIKKAVKQGAKMIVLPGEIFDEVLFDVQDQYPDISFLLIDGIPHNKDFSKEAVAANTRAVVFAEEQAGFLAGYAAVRDGYTSLGFLGGNPQDPVIKYGYGFIQGADYAAIELGVSVNINYCYGMTFTESEDMKNLAASWYDQGTQVIFACGGAMNRSVIKAAEEKEGYVIGVDVDQGMESDRVITSAMKELTNATYQGVKDFYEGNFKGGEIVSMSALNEGVGLPMESSMFKNFSQDTYNAIYGQLAEGKIEPYASTAFGNTFDLTLINTTVTYLELN